LHLESEDKNKAHSKEICFPVNVTKVRLFFETEKIPSDYPWTSITILLSNSDLRKISPAYPKVASILSATFSCVPSFWFWYRATREMLFPRLALETGSRE